MTEERKKEPTLPADDEMAATEETAESEKTITDAEEPDQGIETLLRKAEENRDRLLRLAADFDNYKKRMERERQSLIKYAGETILRELLPTLDNLDRAVEHATVDTEDTKKKLESLLEGVELTRQGLLAMLKKFEVFPLDCVGLEFNPNEQEALTMEPSNEVPANLVLREFVKGYRFKDRLLRPAKVVVSGGPAQ